MERDTYGMSHNICHKLERRKIIKSQCEEVLIGERVINSKGNYHVPTQNKKEVYL